MKTKKIRHSVFFFMSFLLSAVLFGSLISHTVSAQSTAKPELVKILFDDTKTDEAAKDTIKKFINSSSPKKLEDADFNAKFIPITEKDSNNKYIFAVFEDPEFGGCYARGCFTVIYRNTSKGEWSAVFAAYVVHSYYDSASISEKKPANLIFSSNVDSSDPGVWMWNGKEYVIVNKKP